MKVKLFTFENLNYLISEKQNILVNKIVDELISGNPDFICACGIIKDNFQLIARTFKSRDYVYKKVKELENEIPENLLFYNKDSNYMIEDTSLYRFKKSKETRFISVYKIIKKIDFKVVIPVFPAGYPDADKLNQIYKPENTGPAPDYFTLGITTLEIKLPNYRLDQLKEISEFSQKEKQVIIAGNFNITKWQRGNIENYEDAWSFTGELEDNDDRFDRIYYKGTNLTNFQYLVEDLYYNEETSSYGIETEFDM